MSLFMLLIWHVLDVIILFEPCLMCIIYMQFHENQPDIKFYLKMAHVRFL